MWSFNFLDAIRILKKTRSVYIHFDLLNVHNIINRCTYVKEHPNLIKNQCATNNNIIGYYFISNMHRSLNNELVEEQRFCLFIIKSKTFFFNLFFVFYNYVFIHVIIIFTNIIIYIVPFFYRNIAFLVQAHKYAIYYLLLRIN